MKKEIIGILEDLQPEVDFEECNTIIDDHLLDSLLLITLVATIEEEFDVSIPAVDIIPDNFNSAEAIQNLINRLKAL